MSRPAIAYINLEHLRHNYRLLQQTAAVADIMAVVKANAYGHGLAIVAPVLFAEGCRQFAVTDATEGMKLRNILAEADQTTTAEIVLLSGIFDTADAALARAGKLTPAISDALQATLLQEAGFSGRVWIKVDTGMSRLGAESPRTLIDQCCRAGIQIRGIMSHLACADIPDHPMNRQQAESFTRLCEHADAQLPRSLLNSAGIIALPDQCLDVVRPGIALYGAEPVPDQPLGLKPVMTMTATIMQVRHIKAGETVSYAATFTASKAMRIAIVSAGYADGIPRSLSGCGHGICHGTLLPITGRVCMDYTLFDITDTDFGCGDSVEFWGIELTANDVATRIDTISYALFIGVGERVRRVSV